MFVGYILSVLDNIHVLTIICGLLSLFGLLLIIVGKDLYKELFPYKKILFYTLLGCLIFNILCPNSLCMKWVSKEIKENSQLQIQVIQMQTQLNKYEMRYGKIED